MHGSFPTLNKMPVSFRGSGVRKITSEWVRERSQCFWISFTCIFIYQKLLIQFEAYYYYECPADDLFLLLIYEAISLHFGFGKELAELNGSSGLMIALLQLLVTRHYATPCSALHFICVRRRAVRSLRYDVVSMRFWVAIVIITDFVSYLLGRSTLSEQAVVKHWYISIFLWFVKARQAILGHKVN